MHNFFTKKAIENWLENHPVYDFTEFITDLMNALYMIWDVAETSDRYSADDRIAQAQDLIKKWGLD